MTDEKPLDNLVKKMDERMDEKIQSNNSDMSALMEGIKSTTVQEMINHKPCGDENCPLCSMKADLDKAAYERGLNDGVELNAKI